MGDDSCLWGCGFESRRSILDGHDISSHWFVVKIVLFVCLKRPKINKKRPGLGPFLKKKNITTQVAATPTWVRFSFVFFSFQPSRPCCCWPSKFCWLFFTDKIEQHANVVLSFFLSFFLSFYNILFSIFRWWRLFLFFLSQHISFLFYREKWQFLTSTALC